MQRVDFNDRTQNDYLTYRSKKKHWLLLPSMTRKAWRPPKKALLAVRRVEPRGGERRRWSEIKAAVPEGSLDTRYIYGCRWSWSPPASGELNKPDCWRVWRPAGQAGNYRHNLWISNPPLPPDWHTVGECDAACMAWSAWFAWIGY